MTHLRPAKRRRTAPRVPPFLLALLTAASVLVGLFAAGTTSAWLRASLRPAEGVVVHAGSAGLSINGAEEAHLPPAVISPRMVYRTSLHVANTGDVPLLVTGAITMNGANELTPHLTALVTPVSDANACVAGLEGRKGPAENYALDGWVLKQSGTTTLCVEVALAQNTPVTASGLPVAFTLQLSATQQAASK